MSIMLQLLCMILHADFCVRKLVLWRKGEMPFLKILIMTKKWYSRGNSGIIPDVINSNLIYYVKYCNKC